MIRTPRLTPRQYAVKRRLILDHGLAPTHADRLVVAAGDWINAADPHEVGDRALASELAPKKRKETA